MKLQHGYTNETQLANDVVTKHYVGPEAAARLEIETQALTKLAGLLPVPKLLDVDRDTLEVHLEYLAGRHGQELIEEGLGIKVLHLCGEILRQIHSLPPALLFDSAPLQPDVVIVHGDFGPQNMLFSTKDWAVTGLLDWEWAHLGSRFEDIAWAEWIVRTHHPDATAKLQELFDGYGETPAWQDRHGAMMAQCRRILEIAASADASIEVLWEQRLDATSRFEEN